MNEIRESKKKLSYMKIQDARTGNICMIKQRLYQELSKASEPATVPAEIAEHLSERQRVMRRNL